MSMTTRCPALRLVRQSILSLGLLMLPTQAFAETGEMFKRIPTQYIAALGKPAATAGTGAQRWGLWRRDPGPRGVWLKRFDRLKSADGVAPAKWTFDANDWWLDENGLIMEKPDFSLPPGRYLVTGDREALSVLTVHPMDDQGAMRWQLDFGAKLYDVTHLPCRSARYRPATADAACTPDSVKRADFPVSPSHPMPIVSGCSKQDYAVIFVIGMATAKQPGERADTACRRYGRKYPGVRVLETADGSLVLCPVSNLAPDTAATPFMVRKADLRSLEDPSQMPRCNAKDRIESYCGTKELCRLEVKDDLCTEPEIARHTTHVQIEWKCRSDSGWRFNRVERGQDLVFDCR